MKKFTALFLFATSLTACAPGFVPLSGNDGVISNPITYFPVASATLKVETYGSLAMMKNYHRPSILDALLPKAKAQVSQGSATVSVTYNNPSAVTFQINTSALGTAVTVTGLDLNLGTVSISGLDDNSLRVCTGVGAPANRCNRLLIRVFTLGTATGGITNTAGFINTQLVEGIPVFAGTVTTAIGFNANANAASITNAAVVVNQAIPNGTNRLRLQNLTLPSIPIKADLSNAASGPYEMNLVIQYALAYQP